MKSPLTTITQRQRTSRHGEPHKMRKRSVKQMENGTMKVIIEWVPVPAEGYTRKVAAHSTTKYGLKNSKGKAGSK